MGISWPAAHVWDPGAFVPTGIQSQKIGGNGNTIIELDPKLTPRMTQQMAHHTVADGVFADHAPLLFELQKAYHPPSSDPTPRLQRVIIEKGCKEKALKFLEGEGKTASEIFPDIEGLGRFLRWHLDSLLTTLL